MICRDNDRLRRLAEVPVSLLRASGAVFDEYAYSWVEALQSFWLGRQDVGDRLVAAVDGTSPEALRYADTDLVSKVLCPPMILLYRVIRRDAVRFGTALADALRLHKAYWTADEDRATSADGLVALGPPWPWPASPGTKASPWMSSPATCPGHSWNTPGSVRSRTDLSPARTRSRQDAYAAPSSHHTTFPPVALP